MADLPAKPREGWAFPGGSRKAHYFVGRTSLCGKWLWFGPLDPHNAQSQPDDCMTCEKKRAALRRHLEET